MDKIEKVLKRLEGKFDAYAEERDSDDEEGMIDVSLACDLADSVPYLIKTIRNLQAELKNTTKITHLGKLPVGEERH